MSSLGILILPLTRVQSDVEKERGSSQNVAGALVTANLETEDASESISFNACEVAKQADGVKEIEKEDGQRTTPSEENNLCVFQDNDNHLS